MMIGLAAILRRLVPPPLRPRIRLLLFEWLRLDWTLSSGIRIHLSAYGDWITYNEIFVAGEYDRAVALAFDRAGAAGTPIHVVDLGASSGFFTLRVFHEARVRGIPVSITAVEGHPLDAERFRRRLANQPVEQDRVHLAEGLVGERSGAGVLYEGSPVASSTIRTGPGGSTRVVARVPYMDLSEILKAVPRIGLLKCDIEGSEEAVIENYPDVFAKVDVAVFEFHRDLCNVDRCQAMLRRYGFTHEATLRNGEVNFTYWVWR